MWLLWAVRGSSILPRLPVAGFTEEPQADTATAASSATATVAILDFRVTPSTRAPLIGTGMRREGRG